MNKHPDANKHWMTKQAAMLSLLAAVSMNSSGAATDLAPAPLITTPTASVLPNVFLMVDDSGSMGWDYMPDNAGNFNAGTYGAASNQCNGVYYDPATSYTVPVDAAGSPYLDATFTAAWKDGYNTALGTVNLSTSFVDTGGDPAQPAFYYAYSGTQTTEQLKDYYKTTSTFYKECNSTVSKITLTLSGTSSTSVTSITVGGTAITSGPTAATTSSVTLAGYIASAITATGYVATASASTVTIIAPASAAGATLTVNQSGTMTISKSAAAFPTVAANPGAGVFTKTLVASAAAQQNFANWYSYYRTRMLTMKTATGLAFKTISDSFRVGMATMNNNKGTDFIALAPFDAAQKTLWYSKLYGIATGSSTPLREALSNAGRMYAMKLPLGKLNTVTVPDPIQFSCQQNFTILNTDGFWNGPTNYNLSGGTVGNQDGTEIRPMYDGANQTSQTVTVTDTLTRLQSVKNVTYVWPYTDENVSVSATMNCAATTTLPAGCVKDTNNRTWCMYTANNVGSTGRCSVAMGSGSAYGCRLNAGLIPADTNPDGAPCVSDTNGQQWCVYTNNTTGTNCGTQLQVSGVNIGVWVCKPPIAPNSGYTVTRDSWNASWTGNYTETTVTDNPSTTTTTTVTVNGVVQPPVVTTTTGAATTISDDFVYIDGIWSGWTGPVTTTSCTATPPAPGWNWYWGTMTQTNGPATVTTLSTTSTPQPPVTTSSSSGGTSDTLADVAEYYYITDLRTAALGNNISGTTGTDISENNVPASGADAASHQHMTTFTLGLGARGRMVFDPSYQSATTGDFAAVKQGSTATAAVCTWQAAGTTCNWPTPASNAIENIDDLWHAAVNGRGTYFSAANASDLSIGLTTALAGVSARRGSAAAATTSTAFITQGDNFLFHSSFVSQQWVGDLTRQQLDLATGGVLPAVDWAAQEKLDVQATRNIHFFNTASASGLSPFLWANLNATQQSYFDLTQIQTLSQSCPPPGATCLSPGNQTLAAGANLVNYIRGDRTNEGALADNTKYYRQRLHLLGDIVNSESAYVKGGMASFGDPGYSTFKNSATVTSRKGIVYVGANDGMLHAFRAADDTSTPAVDEGGQEEWAYIPSPVMPNLHTLADKGYGINPLHQYYVDGTPVTSDICISSCDSDTLAVWKTILVGGLNRGGRGYYALDITDPDNPKGLWEFTDANMGYSYGNPKIVKLKDGRWVVLVTSGYNNAPPDAPSGDGQGHLYVLEAYTGTVINDLSTGAGSILSPSGLARIDAALSSPGTDASVLVVYGGDLEGNLWRFDINGTDTQTPKRWADIGAAGFDAQLLATLRDAAGNAQPITSKPLLTLAKNNLVVIVGTGRYLGSSDLVDTSQQSFYAIKDPFTNGTTPSVAIWGNPRTEGTFVQQIQTTGTCPAGSSTNLCSAGQSVTISTNKPVDFSTDGGWYFDFAHSGERVNTDPDIARGVVILTANIPNSSSCTVGGESYFYFINYMTGGSLTTTGVTGRKFGNELASNPKVIYLPGGETKACVQGSAGGDPNCLGTPPPNDEAGSARRISWRELTPN